MEFKNYKHVVVHITRDIKTNKNIMFVNKPRTAFVPSYVYYLLEYNNCDIATFGTSLKEYLKEDLKGKENWNEVQTRI